MSRDHHSHRSHAQEQAPKSDFIVANLEKESSAGTLHALSELQDLSKKDPKAFARVLAEVNEKVDTSFLSIDKNGNSHGDLQIVGFDKNGSLIMKDENDELFDPRVNLKNGILEIRRPIMTAQGSSADGESTNWAPDNSRNLSFAPAPERTQRPVLPEAADKQLVDDDQPVRGSRPLLPEN